MLKTKLYIKVILGMMMQKDFRYDYLGSSVKHESS